MFLSATARDSELYGAWCLLFSYTPQVILKQVVQGPRSNKQWCKWQMHRLQWPLHQRFSDAAVIGASPRRSNISFLATTVYYCHNLKDIKKPFLSRSISEELLNLVLSLHLLQCSFQIMNHWWRINSALCSFFFFSFLKRKTPRWHTYSILEYNAAPVSMV